MYDVAGNPVSPGSSGRIVGPSPPDELKGTINTVSARVL